MSGQNGMNDKIRISFNIRKPGKPATLFVSLVMIAVLGFLDYISGYEMSFSIFYLVPISYAAFFAGAGTGVFISMVSAATWLAADLSYGHQYSNVAIPVWNMITRLGYFILHTLLLSKFVKLHGVTRNLSITDPLTGAYNWRFFEEVIAREKERSKRTGKPFSLAYFDLDNFKSLNDTEGHSAGDDLLRTITSDIRRVISSRDVLARLGGDEFIILLSETEIEEAKKVVQKLSDELLKTMNRRKWPVTLSIGVIVVSDPSLETNLMVKMVDDLMYKAKKGGKNSVEYAVYGERFETHGS